MPVIKIGLGIGACIVVGFLYLFGLENFRVQLLTTAGVAAMIGVLMGLILLLDYPFRGDVSVSPTLVRTSSDDRARTLNAARADYATLPRAKPHLARRRRGPAKRANPNASATSSMRRPLI
jgi:hypothetical protein